MRPHIEARSLPNGGKRVVFLYPKKPEFAAAARAIKIRGAMSFGENPIKGYYAYKAFYHDITRFDAETYALYAMLVRDFYASDIRARFDALFPGIDTAAITPSVHNPNEYMAAQAPLVAELIAKYKDSTSPLEFYGSRHMAEGVAMILAAFRSKESKGLILADEQGMAKTIQTVVASLEAHKKRVLVVAPKTARVTTWPTEIAKADPAIPVVLASYNDFHRSRAAFTVIGWDDLRRIDGMEIIHDLKMQKKLGGTLKPFQEEQLTQALTAVREKTKDFDLVIADEAHRAKHRTSKRSAALHEICENVPHIILTTGTPITKRPKDVLAPLAILHHPLAANPKQFLARYHVENRAGERPQIKKQRLNELHALLRDVYIRREKSQTNLPPKSRRVEKLKLPPETLQAIAKQWADYERDHATEMAKPDYPYDLVRNGKMREFSAIHKVPYIVDWAEDLIEAGEKVVIFTQFTDVIHAYQEAFGKQAVAIYGATNDRDRADAVKRFQTDPSIKVFIGNVRAAGESITLHRSAHLAFNDFPWLPTEVLQAEDRICRGGQTRPTTIWFFLANTEADRTGFNDFIHSKEVVAAATNRRDEAGQIKDATWDGDTSETAIEEQANEVEEDFDWEDAGEEPPEVQEVDYRELSRKKKKEFYSRLRKQHPGARLIGDSVVLPSPIKSKKEPPAMPALSVRQVGETLDWLSSRLTSDWERKFSADISTRITQGQMLSDKQKEVVRRLLRERSGIIISEGGPHANCWRT